MRWLTSGNLVGQIIIGLLAGILLAVISPDSAKAIGLLGELFVRALKAVAPILVLVLVISSIANHAKGQKTSIRPIATLYLLSTFFAAVVAVVASFHFPQQLSLNDIHQGIAPPRGIGYPAGTATQYCGEPAGCTAKCQLYRYPGLGDWLGAGVPPQ